MFERATFGRTMLIGRERERAALQRSLEEATRGEGSAVMLRGAPGVGKTRMAAEIAPEAARRGFLALGGCCYDGEDSVPFITGLLWSSNLNHLRLSLIDTKQQPRTQWFGTNLISDSRAKTATGYHIPTPLGRSFRRWAAHR